MSQSPDSTALTVDDAAPDPSAPIVIPSLKSRSDKEWFEAFFSEREYGKNGNATKGKCIMCLDKKEVRQKNGYSNFGTHILRFHGNHTVR